MKLFHMAVLTSIVCVGSGCVNVEVDGSAVQGRPSAISSAAKAKDDSWADTIAGVAGNIFLGSESSVIFYAFDVLSEPNKPVEIAAKLQTVRFADIQDVTVGFYRASEQIGEAQTDLNGTATITWLGPSQGDYSFSARIIEVPDDQDSRLRDVPAVPVFVAVRDANTPFVVIDLDHTVVDSSFFRVLLGGGTPMADSVKIVRKIADKYSLIYLTHRPDLMTHRSKSWLQKHGYPAGPLLVSTLKQSIGASGRFKSGRIAELKKTFKHIDIGIGDKLSDAQAYVDNGMTAYLIPHYDREPKDMRKMASQLRDLSITDRLRVVSTWRQVESGIFADKDFPAGDFAARLEKQADQLAELDD